MGVHGFSLPCQSTTGDIAEDILIVLNYYSNGHKWTMRCRSNSRTEILNYLEIISFDSKMCFHFMVLESYKKRGMWN